MRVTGDLGHLVVEIRAQRGPALSGGRRAARVVATTTSPGIAHPSGRRGSAAGPRDDARLDAAGTISPSRGGRRGVLALAHGAEQVRRRARRARIGGPGMHGMFFGGRVVASTEAVPVQRSADGLLARVLLDEVQVLLGVQVGSARLDLHAAVPVPPVDGCAVYGQVLDGVLGPA